MPTTAPADPPTPSRRGSPTPHAALQLLDALPQVGGATSGVALWAHVGGFATGAAIAGVVRYARGPG